MQIQGHSGFRPNCNKKSTIHVNLTNELPFLHTFTILQNNNGEYTVGKIAVLP